MSFQDHIVDRLREFSIQEPEIVFQWKDKYSLARGILVINSLRGNAAGGGTRVHANVTLDEVTALAKIMEIKFALSGPSIGGAKTGIKFDPNHPDKYAVLERWYEAITPLLRERYGTGSDLNTDIHRINTILKKIGINSSQEGIIHAISSGNNDIKKRAYENMSLLNSDVNLGGLTVKLAELVTGFGVASSVISYYQNKAEDLKGKRIFLQGVGNVGAAAAYFLQEKGCVIVAMSDHDCGVVSIEGFSKEQILTTLKNRRLLNVIQNDLTHSEFNNKLGDLNINIFIPAAGSNIVSKGLIDELIDGGLELICSGANHPFVENEHCYGTCSQYVDSRLTLLPDFLANMGMARTFYKLMTLEDNSLLNCETIFDDIRSIIQRTVSNAYELNKGTLMTASLYNLALDNIT
jgi:glutamate dehydrogenase/leucine dehydrogenase